MSCRSAPNCSERRHTAREQQAEARITYRFHPRFGESVRVRRRLERGGAAFVVVHQLDGTFACLSSGGGIARPGFERLLATICDGRVGAVLAIEASRLARNGRDWHTLIARSRGS